MKKWVERQNNVVDSSSRSGACGIPLSLSLSLSLPIHSLAETELIRDLSRKFHRRRSAPGLGKCGIVTGPPPLPLERDLDELLLDGLLAYSLQRREERKRREKRRLDGTRRDETRRDETKPDETRRNETRRDEARLRLDETRRDKKRIADRDDGDRPMTGV